MPFVPFLLDVNTTIVPGNSTTSTTAVATTADAVSGSTGLFADPMTLMLAYIVVLGVIMYFFSIKPAKKKEQAAETMRNQISVGDSVLLKTGMFGKVVDVTHENFIIELGLNKTVNVPVLKTEIYAVREVNLSNEAPEPPALPEKPSKKKDKKKED